MSIVLTKNDRALLKGVHPDLVKVIEQAARITTIPFKITEGLRSIAQQKKNVAKGVSWTMNSRHLTGHAVDLVPMVDIDGDGKVSAGEQYSWPIYYKLGPIIKQAAKQVGVPVEWGADWKKNKDGPHWQLPFKQYPAMASASTNKPLADIQATEPPATHETEDANRVKHTAVLAAAGSGDVASNIQPLGDAANAVMGQQSELSSGDILRIVVALVILGLVGYGIWKMWKK